jgi:hypothetical protein
MRIDFCGLTLETPRVTVYLWSPWRATALEHRIIETVRAHTKQTGEQDADEWRLHLDDARAWRAAHQAILRVVKGWQEEAAGSAERRSWRWLFEGDCDAHGYDHVGEPSTLWAFLRVTVERGGMDDPEKAEDLDLEGVGLRFWGDGAVRN